jgi:hypothetical protein
VLAAEAPMMEPLAVNRVGGMTHAVFNATVPLAVMVPPVKPAPAVIEVTVPAPLEGVTHCKPDAVAELAVNT